MGTISNIFGGIMRKQHVLGLFVLGAIALAGCSSAGGPSSENQPEPSTATVISPETTSSAEEPTEVPPEPVGALTVAERLQAAIPSVSSVTEVTENNDSNNLIGRPGQYVTAAWVADASADPTQTGIDGGAVVEVFANAEDAQSRSTYIQDTLRSMGPAFGTEYHYFDGSVLLRVSGVIVPSQAALYEQAFAG